MKRIVWSTDIHLNFVKPDQLAGFFSQLRDASPDIILIGGDIAESTDVVRYLEMLDDALQRPIYFVLGNHDFYFGSIARVREEIRALCARRANLIYLTDREVLGLTGDMGLIGHDGWADARVGDYERSMIMMNDYRLIEELAGVTKEDRWPILKQMGDDAAADVRAKLLKVLDQYTRVFLLTHVPPLRQACWYDGRISDDEWAPHFTCKAVGDVLIEVMRDYPDHELTVLCGHTHGSGETEPLRNLHIFTGGAEYGFPAINRQFTLS